MMNIGQVLLGKPILIHRPELGQPLEAKCNLPWSMPTRETTVSAPGKVLIAGGYLVLDPAYTGLVLATNARFYTNVSSSTRIGHKPLIRVRSPQFKGAEWIYACELPGVYETSPVEAANAFKLRQLGNDNLFVALSLLYGIHVAFEQLGASNVCTTLSNGLDIVIAGDNDYYSHRVDGRAPSHAQLQALEPFASHACTLGEVHKTGLGSSAAMTTSLVAALLLHLNAITVSVEDDGQLTTRSLGLVHNVAQLAHCAAQGKVGSGFDVSASVWGHQLYRRFDPALIKDLMYPEVGSRIITSQENISHEKRPLLALLPILDPRNPLWVPAPPPSATTTAIEGLAMLRTGTEEARKARPAPLPLPPGVRMCLADVDTGSNTRTMVGRVSDWRRQNLIWADQLYKIIATSNQSLADGLLQLHMAYVNDSSNYTQVLEGLSHLPSKEWDLHLKSDLSPVYEIFVSVRNAMRSIRAGMRELGLRSGAPVEPPEMSQLLDTTINGAPGILGGGIPGAGGYDAMFLLFLDPASLTASAPSQPMHPPKDVCDLWLTYRDLSVGPLLCGSDDITSSYVASLKDRQEDVLSYISRVWAHAPVGLHVVSSSEVPGLERVLRSNS